MGRKYYHPKCSVSLLWRVSQHSNPHECLELDFLRHKDTFAVLILLLFHVMLWPQRSSSVVVLELHTVIMLEYLIVVWRWVTPVFLMAWPVTSDNVKECALRTFWSSMYIFIFKALDHLFYYALLQYKRQLNIWKVLLTTVYITVYIKVSVSVWAWLTLSSFQAKISQSSIKMQKIVP